MNVSLVDFKAFRDAFYTTSPLLWSLCHPAKYDMSGYKHFFSIPQSWVWICGTRKQPRPLSGLPGDRAIKPRPELEPESDLLADIRSVTATNPKPL
jgi:hypothetical protein